MAATATTEFLSGVIEGFYGKPWSHDERLGLFDWMAAWGLDTYVYAPKDDLKHRARWREAYADSEAAAMAELLRACAERGLRFVYALSPGLDIRFGREADLNHLCRRFDQMLGLGCGDFALLFDDIPARLDPDDARRFGSAAAAQCHVTNALFGWLRERRPAARLLFCPTPYCGRMAERGLGGKDYLDTLGGALAAGIDVFWTGPEIISREITVEHVDGLTRRLGRKPVIWDNLHANDYDGRRFFCGPPLGRSPELRSAVGGWFSNPNCEFPLNEAPLRILSAFLRSEGEWDARAAYRSAMRDWLPSFDTVAAPVSLEELVLFGDCHYLPHEDGPEAEALYQAAEGLLSRPPADWEAEGVARFVDRATRLRDACARMSDLRDRRLFYALSRRIWDLREELDLLLGYVQARSRDHRLDSACESDFHLPGTFRGGFVARLQRLLVQQPDGGFRPARGPASAREAAAPKRTSTESL